MKVLQSFYVAVEQSSRSTINLYASRIRKIPPSSILVYPHPATPRRFVTVTDSGEAGNQLEVPSRTDHHRTTTTQRRLFVEGAVPYQRDYSGAWSAE